MALIQLTGVTLKHFRSIKNLTWDIEGIQPGLIFVSGENGAGKSSISEGIVWTLYGHNSRNIRTPTLVSWGVKKRNIYGCVSFIKNDVRHKVERTHNTLKLYTGDESEVVQQSDVNDVLGLDFSSFIWLVYIPQFGIRFFDLSPSEKLSLFTSIMEDTLSKWSDYAERASDSVKKLGSQIFDETEDKNRVKGILQGLTTKEYARLSKDFEKNRKSKIKNLLERKHNLIADINRFTTLKEEYNEKIAEAERKIEGVRRKQQQLQRDKVRQEKIKSTLNGDKRVIETRKAMNRSQVHALESIDSECFTCHQSVSPDVKTTQIAQLNTVYDRMLTHQRKLDQKFARVSNEIDELNMRINRTSAKDDRLDEDIHDFERAKHEAQYNVNTCSDSLQNVRDDIKALKSQHNEYDKLIDNTKVKKKLLKRVAGTLDEELEELNHELVASTYWKTGFKNIRIMLLRQAVKEFEAYVNDNLDSLGLDDWQVTLDVESETKSGKVRRELSVLINTSENGEKMSVPFNVWSGGEGQRLRLAGILGMIDFIENYNDVEFDIEIYDEPTTWLNNEGISNLIETLSERADSLQRRILVIDHRDLGTMGRFDGTIEVVKNANGTQITEGGE